MRTLKTRIGRPKGSKNRYKLGKIEISDENGYFPIKNFFPVHQSLEGSRPLIERAKKNINGHAFKGQLKYTLILKKDIGSNLTIKETQKGQITKSEVREALVPFSEMEHRNQKLKTVRGVRFIDDSFSSSVNATWFSLEENRGPIILIIGGDDSKEKNYQVIFDLICKKVKAIIFLGEKPCTDLDKFFGKVVPLIFHEGEMKKAVEIAFQIASSGETVLFSPAIPPEEDFDNDYKKRGMALQKIVLSLE